MRKRDRERIAERNAIKQAVKEAQEAFPTFATDHDEFEKALVFRNRRLAELSPPQPPQAQQPPPRSPPKASTPASGSMADLFQIQAPSYQHVEPKQSTNRERIADDLLIGANAIADELGVDRDRVYYLARKKKLPIGKLGKTLIASRSKLRRAIQALT